MRTTLLIAMLVGCVNDNPSQTPRPLVRDQQARELYLESTLLDEYNGPCREKVGDSFKRNGGREKCTVLEQKSTARSCKQKLGCEPTQVVVIGPSGNELAPNKVCENRYIGGKVAECQKNFKKAFSELKDSDSKSELRRLLTEYIACMEEARNFPHYDCDDYVLDYPKQYPNEDSAGFWGLGCHFGGTGGHLQGPGRHGVSIVQLGPRKTNGMCEFAAVDPQAGKQDPSKPELAPENIILFTYEAACDIPMPPEPIRNQRKLTDCEIWPGDIHSPTEGPAMELPYYMYPDGQSSQPTMAPVIPPSEEDGESAPSPFPQIF